MMAVFSDTTFWFQLGAFSMLGVVLVWRFS